MAMTPEERQARLVSRRAAKIVWNKAAVDALYEGMADGLIDIGERIIAQASANAPRDPETAAKRGDPMMADTGTFAVWAMGKLVSGDATRAAGQNKGRVKTGTKTNDAGQIRSTYRTVKTPADQAILFVGFRSPLAHLVELGTIKMNARPFFLPSFNAIVPGAESVIVPAMGKRVRAAR